ncbi:MAG TPA: PASTA domain-containing protein [Actinomycetota bacterium]|nr:PASTA domain-containing protein [Actinomycetota bacterium]
MEEKEGAQTSGPDEAQSADEALWAHWNTRAVSEAEETTRGEEPPVEETTRGEEPPADEVELARRVAHEAAVRHADIARQLERMAQVAEDAAGQAAHAREEDEAARTAEARRVEEAERAAQAASEGAAQRVEEAERAAQAAREAEARRVEEAERAARAAREAEARRVEEAERAAQAAREAAARREETLLQAQHLAARVQELASRAEASRREVEAALREATELFETRQAPEAREEGEARQAAEVQEEDDRSLTKRTFRRTRKGATGEASLRLAPPDRVVVIPEVPSAPSDEGEGALPIGQAPETRRARKRIPGFLRRGNRHRKLNLAVLAGVIAAMIAGAIAGVVPGILTGTLFQGDLPSEQSPATEVNGEESGIVVPELAGLTASQAREVLITVNLRMGGSVPVRGEPGVVAGTRPGTGEVVRPGGAVTLLIGVEPDRLERESAWGTPR